MFLIFLTLSLRFRWGLTLSSTALLESNFHKTFLGANEMDQRLEVLVLQ